MADAVAEPVPTTTSTQPDSLPDPSAGLSGPPSAQGLPVDNRPPAQTPTQAAPPEKESFLSGILHAVGDALGGPKTSDSGAPISTAARVLHGVGTIGSGIAAGAAAHGPGAVGEAAALGAQSAQKQAQQQKENTLANRKQTQEELMNKATMAYHNNQMLLQQREQDRLSAEDQTKNAESNRAFESVAQEHGWIKPPILVNGEDVNGKPDNEESMMKYFSGPGSHQAPAGYVYSYLPTTDAQGKPTHAVYLAPVNSMDQPVTLDKDKYKEQTGIDAPGKEFTLKLGDLVSQRSAYAKSQLEGAQAARDKEASDRAEKMLSGQVAQQGAELSKTNAETSNLRSESEKNLAEARALGTAQVDTPDALGFKPDLPPGGIKEYNKRVDSFKKNIDSLAQTEGTYQQFGDILNDVNQGKDLTGAQSVVGLFNAIGISVEPLKGKGMRINKNIVEDHQNARSFGQDLYQKWLSLKKGDIITPQQIKDYASIASQVRTNEYVNLINQMHADGVKADSVLGLLKGNGRRADDGTIKIFVAGAGGDMAKAHTAMTQMGWQ